MKNVAAVVSGMDEEYPYHIINGINDFARKHDINISYFSAFGGIIDSRDFDIGEYSIYSLPDFSRFDGAILLTNTFANADTRDSICKGARDAGIPTLVFECEKYDEFYNICIDNYSAMKRLVEHLIQIHHAKTFQFIGGPLSHSEAQIRYQAFLDALRENGLNFDDRRYIQGRFRSYDGINAVEIFQESGLSLPDAFVFANDSMALSAMSKLSRLGVKIPEDVIVTGFDNTVNAQNSSPRLTTVNRPLYETGVKSCSILCDLMNGKKHPKRIVLEAEPVYAQSCGCMSCTLADSSNYIHDFSRRLEDTYINVHILNRLIASLAGAENIEECSLALKQMIQALDIDHFSLCLIEDWENSHRILSFGDESQPRPERMTAPFIWNRGEIRSVESFPSSQIYPEPFRTGGNISYLLPLHFDERFLGYCIITNNDFPIHSLLCHTICLCLGNAIDSISKLNVLDPLCKVYNRNGFYEEARQLIQSCASREEALMISFVDLDDLKEINDNFGHKEGDFALQQMAAVLSSCCRGGMDICARFGGDEFVVLCVNIPEDFAAKFEKKLQKTIDEVNARISKPYRLSASIGSVIEVPSGPDPINELIQQADEKMYEVKKKRKARLGKGRRII